MNLRRRIIALLAAAGLALTACGTESRADESAQTRSFTNSLGTTVEIPTEPERIVTTTDQNALLPLLELGVTPVGSAGQVDPATGEGSFRRTDGFDTEGIEFVGAYGEPNLEQVAALDPDLILGDTYSTETVADTDIAPVVSIEIFGQSLADALMDFADVVGRTEEAQDLRDDYEDRVEDLKRRIHERHPDLTVTFVSTFEPGLAYIQDFGQALGTVAHDLDLGRPAAQSEIDRLGGEGGSTELSIENLTDHDADLVFVVDYGGDDGDTATRDLIRGPVWQGLEAMDRGQLHVIDGTTAVGAAWARMDVVLDLLEEHLLAEDLVSTGLNS